jgi:cytosine/adenosine deaminase-related metal-dependent hydrolase
VQKITTLIEGGWIIGQVEGEHRLLTEGVVVYNEDEIVHIGKSYSGRFDDQIDARGKIVSPGFINTHCHVGTPINSSAYMIDEDLRYSFSNPSIPYLPTLEKKGVNRLNNEQFMDVATYSLCSLIKSGCTTIIEVGAGNESLVKIAGETGIRAYLGPGFRNAEPYTGSDGTFYNKDWNEERGLKGLEEAEKFIERFDGSYNHKIKGILVPSQVDNCSPQLLRETRKTADRMNVNIATHAGQRILEFQEILRKYRKTPIEYLKDSGLLGSDLFIGHTNIISGHSWSLFPGDSDVEILAETRTNVSHCPFVSARISWVLESYDRYLKSGVNMTLGTDTWPTDIINEMRWASLICKIIERDSRAGSSVDVYNAVTINSAKGLGRKDIGGLTKGGKADIIIIDLNNFRYAPIFNPIKSLVNAGTMDDIETVIIDGKKIVENKKILNIDEKKVTENVNKIAEERWDQFREWDIMNRKIEDLDTKSLKPYS